jgi:hypothetical protein
MASQSSIWRPGAHDGLLELMMASSGSHLPPAAQQCLMELKLASRNCIGPLVLNIKTLEAPESRTKPETPNPKLGRPRLPGLKMASWSSKWCPGAHDGLVELMMASSGSHLPPAAQQCLMELKLASRNCIGPLVLNIKTLEAPESRTKPETPNPKLSRFPKGGSNGWRNCVH